MPGGYSRSSRRGSRCIRPAPAAADMHLRTWASRSNLSGSLTYPQPQMLTVGEMQHRFDETGEITDEEFRPHLESYIKKFLVLS